MDAAVKATEDLGAETVGLEAAELDVVEQSYLSRTLFLRAKSNREIVLRQSTLLFHPVTRRRAQSTHDCSD